MLMYFLLDFYLVRHSFVAVQCDRCVVLRPPLETSSFRLWLGAVNFMKSLNQIGCACINSKRVRVELLLLFFCRNFGFRVALFGFV